MAMVLPGLGSVPGGPGGRHDRAGPPTHVLRIVSST